MVDDDQGNNDPTETSIETTKQPLFERLIGYSNEADIVFEGKHVKALVDTGSMITSVSELFYTNLTDRPPLHKLTELQLRGADGKEIPYLGYIEANIELQASDPPKLLQVPVLVVNNTDYNLSVPVIIGTNAIKMLEDSDMLPSVWKTACNQITNGCVGIVKSINKENVTIQPYETVDLKGYVKTQSKVATAITEYSTTTSARIGVCPRIVSLEGSSNNKRVPVRIFNMSAKPVIIKPRSVLCELHEVSELRRWDPETENKHDNRQEQNDTKEKHAFLEKVNIDLNHVGNIKKEKLHSLFWQYKDVFSTGNLDIGNTDLIRHEIKLTTNEPFKESYRRVPPALIDEVREHLQEMLDMGAIRPSQSPYSSNVVIVRKKDGSIRFCIDYRKLNSITQKDAYNIPKIDETLHLLAGSKYFSKLDLKSGYWQVELNESDKEKTAFQAGSLGFYECNRMPFGLCNAPATFQRLMEKCMGESNLKECLIYLDDVIIFSTDFEQHLQRLEAVFQQLKRHKLKLKPSKCEFLKTEVKYLGHIVSKDGIQVDMDKIEVVKKWPTPRSTKDVQRFLGFAGYYRKFINNFSSIVRPLNDLLVGTPGKHKTQQQQKRPFTWGPDQQKAFKTIIHKLTSTPILGYANYSEPFKVHTDASSDGLGAVLYQEQEGKDRVIAYASRSLKPAEKNYHSSKLEFLALKWAITEKFHDYLYGGRFTVYTDNNPLTYIHTTAKLNASGQRWIAELANYDFNILYRSGKSNVEADALSRMFADTSKTNTIDKDVIQAVLQAGKPDVSEINDDNDKEDSDTDEKEAILNQTLTFHSQDWTHGQESDPSIKRLIHLVATGSAPQTKSETPEMRKYIKHFSKYFLEDGILYHNGHFNEQSAQQIVLPGVARKTIFHAYHDDLGHQGRDRTLSLLKERFFWPNMDSQVRCWISQCRNCLARKTPQQIQSKLQNIQSTYPMEIICIDYLSLETSKGGFENILVITDHFTRYAQAIPTRNQTARTTARVLFDNYFVHYGFPAKLHSDRGQNFLSKTIKRLCQITGVKRSRTTPYHPQGNGQCERFNKTLLQMLGTLPSDKKSDWKSAVPTLVHAYNSTIHSSTGYSPHELMYGRKSRLAIDAVLGLKRQTVTGNCPNEYMKKLENNLKRAYEQADKTAKLAGHRYKRNYDKKVRENKLNVGDRVLLKNVGLKGKQKLANVWGEHVYRVIRQRGDEIPVYDVMREDGSGLIRTMHRNNILVINHLPLIDYSNSSTFEGSPSDEDVNHSKHGAPSDAILDTSSSDDESQNDVQRKANRPRRTRKPPLWHRDYRMN